MRLSDREMKILGVIELDAALSVGEIARRSKLQTHSVTYGISKLRDNGILGPMKASINAYRLGYCDFHLIFSLSTGKQAKRESFITAIGKTPQVNWLAEIGGTHQLAMSIRVRKMHEALTFMAHLREKFPNFIRDQQLSIINTIVSYGRQYLYGRRKSIQYFRNSVSGETIDSLDSVDYRILSGLSMVGFSSERELARHLGLSFSTLRRRIDLMEKDKIINGYYHHIDCSKVGYQIFKLLIFTRSQDARFLQQLEAFAAHHENVVHYLESLGAWQNEFVIEVQSALEASRLASRVHEQFDSHIEAIHVVPIFQYLKTTSFPGWVDAKRSR